MTIQLEAFSLALPLMCIRIKYFCLRTNEECVDDNFILGDVANILLLLLLLFINKIHSYFVFLLYSYTDVRVEATNRINKRRERERQRKYTRVCFHRFMIVVSMKYWFDKEEKKKNCRSFQHENIHSFIRLTFNKLNWMKIFNPTDWIYVKEDDKLEDWYSRLYILRDYLDDAITHLNKKLTSIHWDWLAQEDTR